MLHKIKMLINIILAMLLLPFHRLIFIKKNIILVGGHEGELFTDNGKVFYEYLLKNKKEEYDIYWVINYNSNDLKKLDCFIIRGSIKNYFYYFFASGLFYTHSASDVGPIIHNFIKPKGVRVYLSHGVEGLKKIRFTKNSRKGMKRRADLFISSSEYESQIKIDHWRLNRDIVKVTGYPRYDNFKKNNKLKNTILFMPTWREWLQEIPLDQFKKTTYFKIINDLLQNNEVVDLLEKNNFQMLVYLHFYFHKFIDAFNIKNNEKIKILSPNVEIQDLLMKSNILITDYSSVCWDFFYLEKPVLFFQFDQVEYEEKRGSYLDLNKELFGLKSTNIINLLNHIELAIKNPEYINGKYKYLKQKYFKYEDYENCKRVMEEFEKNKKNS